ncbi:MAG: hypothetical protein Fur0046_32790 [Cyanobacteria bacterium J069]|nr:MAG: DUF4278 domain-containing protein [Cyanobacteria bacterium J069]
MRWTTGVPPYSKSMEFKRKPAMKLSYRGIKYEAQVPTVATTSGSVIGKYRGVELHTQVKQER